MIRTIDGHQILYDVIDGTEFRLPVGCDAQHYLRAGRFAEEKPAPAKEPAKEPSAATSAEEPRRRRK